MPDVTGSIGDSQAMIRFFKGPGELPSSIINRADEFYKRMQPYFDQALLAIEGEVQMRAPQGATDELARSITHSVFIQPDQEYGSVFINPDSDAATYAMFVEYGRAPGEQPPVDALLPWATKRYVGALNQLHGIAVARGDKKAASGFKRQARKSEARENAVLAYAWALAKYIAKHGTRAQHFFERGVQAGEPQAAQIISIGIDTVVQEMMNA